MPEPAVRPTYATITQWHWHLPSAPQRIAEIVEQVEATLQKLPFDTWAMSDFVIAVSELIQNAFLHAPANTETQIEVSVLYVPTVGVFVGVSDALGPVPPEVFTQDLQTMDRMAEHGRGFPIMRTFSSLLFYNPHGEWKEIILGLAQT
jgi:anti-sigma regulatory factor (Ser/Thr protein kinase)